jgi:hypothetical protein
MLYRKLIKWRWSRHGTKREGAMPREPGSSGGAWRRVVPLPLAAHPSPVLNAIADPLCETVALSVPISSVLMPGPAGWAGGLVTPLPVRPTAVRVPTRGGIRLRLAPFRRSTRAPADTDAAWSVPEITVPRRLATRDRTARTGSLTAASDQYVGSPRESDPPFRTSEWERQISLITQTPPWLAPEPDPEPDVAVPPPRSAIPSPFLATTLRGGPRHRDTPRRHSAPRHPDASQHPDLPRHPAAPWDPTALRHPDAPQDPVLPWKDDDQPRTQPPGSIPAVAERPPGGTHGTRPRRRTLGESRRLGLGPGRPGKTADQTGEHNDVGQNRPAPGNAESRRTVPGEGLGLGAPIPPASGLALPAAEPPHPPAPPPRPAPAGSLAPAAEPSPPRAQATARPAYQPRTTYPGTPRDLADPPHPSAQQHPDASQHPDAPRDPAALRHPAAHRDPVLPWKDDDQPGTERPANFPAAAERPPGGAPGTPPQRLTLDESRRLGLGPARPGKTTAETSAQSDASQNRPAPGNAESRPVVPGEGLGFGAPIPPTSGLALPAAEPPHPSPPRPAPAGSLAPPAEPAPPRARATARPTYQPRTTYPGTPRDPADRPAPQHPHTSQHPDAPEHTDRPRHPDAPRDQVLPWHPAAPPHPALLRHPAVFRHAELASPAVPSSRPRRPSRPQPPSPPRRPSLSPRTSRSPGASRPPGTVRAPLSPQFPQPPQAVTPAEGAPRAARGSHTEAVPTDIAASFGALTGLDLSGTLVHRGPEVSELAHAFQARAFTRSGEIFLPDEAGPLAHGESRALVAHELTHVVQQRVLAPSLPSEDSPDGQELENEAVTAERWFRRGGTPPPRLAHLPITALLARHARPGPERTGPASHTARTADSTRPQPMAETGVQRLNVRDQAGPSAVATTATVAASGNAGPPSVGPTSINGSADSAPTHAARPPEDSIKPRADDRRPADLDDPTSLDELTRKIYPRLRRLLKGELLADRERAGLLSDFS